jgi:hypothetical protein
VAALPPIQRPQPSEAPVLKFPVELAAPAGVDAAPHALGSPMQAVAPMAYPHEKPRRAVRAYLAWTSAAAAMLALVALGYLGYAGYATILDLERRLDDTHETARADRQAIQALEHQQVDLESNVAASAQIIERVDQKSDLILDTIQTPTKKTYRKH